jgi:hypothetical protein
VMFLTSAANTVPSATPYQGCSSGCGSATVVVPRRPVDHSLRNESPPDTSRLQWYVRFALPVHPNCPWRVS